MFIIMREQGPVARSSHHGGLKSVHGHECNDAMRWHTDAVKMKVRKPFDVHISVVVSTAVMKPGLVAIGIGRIRTDPDQAKGPPSARESRTNAKTNPTCRNEWVDFGDQINGADSGSAESFFGSPQAISPKTRSGSGQYGVMGIDSMVATKGEKQGSQQHQG